MFRRNLLWLLLITTGMQAQEKAGTDRTNLSSSERLALDSVVKEVLSSNPAIAGSHLSVEARRRRVTQSGALPDPTVTVSYMGSAVPFKTMAADPSSYRGISAMQMLPLAGKRELKRAMSRKDVIVSEADETAVSRRLVADAKAAFYDYFYYGKALEITNSNKTRLEQLADISEARYRVGKAMQADVLRAHVEVSMLLQRTLALEQQRNTAAARLNTLMNCPIDAVLPPAEDIAKTPLPPIDSLSELATAQDPMLMKEQSMVERNKLAIQMAKKEYVPDLSVGYMYQQRTGLPDMYGMQFSLNIPIFFKSKQRQGVEEAKLDLASSEKSRESRRLELAYELKQMYLTAMNAEKMLDLYDKAIIPQAELALQSAQSSYSVGSTDFLNVVTNFSTIQGYQLDYYRQLADYETALAQIEELTGDLSQIGREAKQ